MTVQSLMPRTRIRGMAPIGITWYATKTKTGVKPDGNCPPGEFDAQEYWDRETLVWKHLTDPKTGRFVLRS